MSDRLATTVLLWYGVSNLGLFEHVCTLSHLTYRELLSALVRENVPQTSPSDTQIRQRMHGMRCMHVDFS